MYSTASVQATNFFEFVKRIADDATEGRTVRAPPGPYSQPMAADHDWRRVVCWIAVGGPVNGDWLKWPILNSSSFDELIRLGPHRAHLFLVWLSSILLDLGDFGLNLRECSPVLLVRRDWGEIAFKSGLVSRCSSS